MAEKNVLLAAAALHESLLGLGGRSQGTNARPARGVRFILAHVRSEDGGSGHSRFQVSNPIVSVCCCVFSLPVLKRSP
uniref:Putative secreted peptide n=1 Tax=Anopheles braziliensis TaxID=58242 RepID=A0A2M3ZVQ2_9DIPT